ncbi:tRNA pseudouridine65 synthase [Reichenbachiella agariperforans]|uniref:tRNA pseudouridine synthase C n=1 Tax=Reichenbachiella agariperforans TaxID=156994 RepID=A0A1M6J1R5_REIAG|nr:pseudouridine synthase [Reichenbachiella agariperforans]SHJ40638.1 tRNA pseudouridine65 synthase [Reichenbachiella agariperforans]
MNETETAPKLEILYQDEDYVIINKPHGLLVHRSKMAANTNRFALQELRNQLNRHVHPAHRLDRKTSGALVFALTQEALKAVRQEFEKLAITKTYWAIVRGYTEDEGCIDYALTNDKGKLQEAITRYRTLDRSEIDVPFGKHQTSRYSLVEVYPETGRMHQIRKHLAHIFHPIIGDRPIGCNKQNKLFLEKWNMNTMLLHAKNISFHHYALDKRISVSACLQPEFIRMIETLGFSKELLS